jgi:hypothetical protein
MMTMVLRGLTQVCFTPWCAHTAYTTTVMCRLDAIFIMDNGHEKQEVFEMFAQVQILPDK